MRVGSRTSLSSIVSVGRTTFEQILGDPYSIHNQRMISLSEVNENTTKNTILFIAYSFFRKISQDNACWYASIAIERIENSLLTRLFLIVAQYACYPISL